jgi:hypothetical protein
MASKAEPDAPPPAVIQRAIPLEQASLAALLQFEGDVRRQGSEAELVYHVANEARRVLAYDQMFVLRQARIGDGFHVIAASSLATIDRNAPLIHDIEKAMATIDRGLAQDIDAHTLAGDADSAIPSYPFKHWRWQPLNDAEGKVFAGMLLTREVPFLEAEAMRLDRIGETAGHSWRALSGGRPVRRIRGLERKEKRGLMAWTAAIALFPTQMSALAPVEVVPARPFVVAAPFSGVIDKIEVSPNARVKQGQLLLRFEDTRLRNELTLATEKLAVARARAERTATAAFGAAEESREISVTRAEYDLAQAEYNYARDVMEKSRFTAPVSGMAIYSDRRDWEGRAVNVGEAIMQIADPRAVAFRIELPAKEQMALAKGARVDVWLDSQPLWALRGRIDTASYQARQTPEGVLAFTITAKPDGATPRIGSRGTAQVHGRWVPLAYSIFRRPIASARQFIGI